MGHFPVAQIAPDDAAFQTLVSLVRDGGWVKLSGAYRLIDAAPKRCVWGSDWPRVAHRRAMPKVGDLLDTLALWAPHEQQRHKILVSRPRDALPSDLARFSNWPLDTGNPLP